MDVIGVGFGRTGTLSLKVALEQLGFGPCLHMVSLLDDAGRSTLFSKAAEGDRDSLRAAFDGHRSTVDWPGTFFWRELIEDYPRAKVILTVRDPQRWYSSVEQTILPAASRRLDQADDDMAAVASREMAEATVHKGTFGGRLADREHAIRVFEEHNEEVRRTVPAGRLLEFQVADGWSPLCAFLGRPVPEAQFPRLNDAVAFKQRLVEAGRLVD